MIALNELLSNIEKYKIMYNKIAFKFDLDEFIKLENERKTIQLNYENLKSSCNKKCNEYALNKLNILETKSLYNEIIFLDKEIKNLSKLLENFNNIINRKLNKLPNLPDYYIEKNITISQTNKSILFTDIINHFANNFTFQNFNNKIEHYPKSIQNKLYSEENVNQLIKCIDGIIIFTTDYQLDNILNEFINYIKYNSINLKNIKTTNINKDSTNKYIAKINTNQSISINLIKEYYTRKYNIKYKNTKIDMTKFVNQINIKFNTINKGQSQSKIQSI